MGEWDHSRLQMLLSRYLSNREERWGVIVVPEQRIQVNATRFRVPDILVMADQCPFTPLVKTPPFPSIEFLSQ